MVPLLGSVCNRDSVASRTRASRTGERDTLKRAAMLTSSISWLGSSTSERISLRKVSYILTAPNPLAFLTCLVLLSAAVMVTTDLIERPNDFIFCC